MGDFGTSHPVWYGNIPEKRRPQIYRCERIKTIAWWPTNYAVTHYSFCSSPLLLPLAPVHITPTTLIHNTFNSACSPVTEVRFRPLGNIMKSLRCKWSKPQKVFRFQKFVCLDVFHVILSRVSPSNRLSSVVTISHRQLPACKNTAFCSQCRPNCLLQFPKQH